MVHTTDPNTDPNIDGIPVRIVKPAEVKIKRTWKERLFTRPYKPFQKFRYELQGIIEDGQITISRNGAQLCMNAESWRKYCKAKENRNA